MQTSHVPFPSAIPLITRRPLACALQAFGTRIQAGRIRVPALAAAWICCIPVLAAQPPEKEPPSSSWGVGIGAAVKQKPYIGTDSEGKVIPILQFENKYVRVFGPGIDVKLPGLRIGDTQRINVSVVGRYDLSAGYEASDSWIFSGMSERKGGIWAGAKIRWENSLANLSAEWLGDASGYSKGQRGGLGLERSWRLGKHLMLSPRLTAKWQDSKYVDYYFGVRDSEATAGRAAYRGVSGISVEAGLRSLFLFGRNHSVILDIGVTKLAPEIKHSPLVGRASESNAFLGYVYRFR